MDSPYKQSGFVYNVCFITVLNSEFKYNTTKRKRDAQSPFNNTLMSKDHGPNFVLEVLFKQVLSKCSHEMSYEGSSFGAINALLTLTCF